MGDHYIPQYYLRGFCPAGSQRLWIYDKEQDSPFPSQPKSVANICNFYSAELEKHLSLKVEGPANRMLDKVRELSEITNDDKEILSEYIAVLWKRVPEGKERFKNSAPKIAEELRVGIKNGIDKLTNAEPHLLEKGEKRKEEVDAILDRFSENPPDDIWHDTIPAKKTPQMIEALKSMSWRFFVVNEKPVFLTCDNPVFFFSSMGIGNQNSELSFPISSNVVLHANRQSGSELGYHKAENRIIKELNRRTAFNAKRFCFHYSEEKWLMPFLKKNKRELNRITW